MKGLISQIESLGVSLAEFMRISKLSYPTLQRLNEGDPNIRASTAARAERTLAQLKDGLANQAKRRSNLAV